jgi:hypothetical protein
MPRIVDKSKSEPAPSSTATKSGRSLMFQRVDNETGAVLTTSTAFKDCFKKDDSTHVEHTWTTR